MNLEPSFVYIVTNKARGTLYLGVTADLVRRVSEHKQAAGRAFTARYNLDKLVWFEPFDHMELAIQPRDQPQALVKRMENRAD